MRMCCACIGLGMGMGMGMGVREKRENEEMSVRRTRRTKTQIWSKVDFTPHEELVVPAAIDRCASSFVMVTHSTSHSPTLLIAREMIWCCNVFELIANRESMQ